MFLAETPSPTRMGLRVFEEAEIRDARSASRWFSPEFRPESARESTKKESEFGAQARRVFSPRSRFERVITEEQKGTLDTEHFVVTEVKVAEVKAKPDGTQTASKISFRGKTLPNSFATLYIYSLPIVVTVKTDSEGNWNYTLDKDLEDGNHQVYVAVTDVKGQVVASSNPIPFVKEAAAVTVSQDPRHRRRAERAELYG